MPDQSLIHGVITALAILAVVVFFLVFVVPLHPRLPAWATWQTYRQSEERAERLLRTVLGEAEYEQFARLGHIEVHSGKFPGRIYRIGGWQEKVAVVENGRIVMLLCADTIEDLPSADVIVAHKLMLEANEEEYLHIANRIP